MIINWGTQSNSDNNAVINKTVLGLHNDKAHLLNAKRYEDVVALAENNSVDLIVRHMNDYDLESFSNIQKIGKHFPSTPFVVLFNHENSEEKQSDSIKHLLQQMEKRKSHAARLEQATDLERKIEKLEESDPEYKEDALTGYHLTPRQKEVLLLIAKGKSNKQIARMLTMSEGTVKIHCMAIFRELGVNNRTQAAMLAEDLLKADA